MIANPVNPRKKFCFSLEFEGLEPALCQKVTLPTLSIDVAEHGAANILIKTGGMIKVGDMEISKLMFANKTENWAYNWMKQVSNPETGSMGVPSQYKRNGFLILLAPDLVSIQEKWQLFGCFPKEIEKEELDKTNTADNLMEKIIFSVDYVKHSG